MKVINVRDAIGKVLCHDITKIVPGEFKGVAFRKGHVIKEEDIPEFLSLGKEHVYVLEDEEGYLHENEAAYFLKDIACGEGLFYSEPKEGKITIYSKIEGLLKIDVDALFQLNSYGEMILSTVHNHTVVKKGDKVGATRIIPLMIEEDKMIKIKELIQNKVINVIPFNKKKVVIITTGNEVFSGRIKDVSYDILKQKLDEYDCDIVKHIILPDDLVQIEKAIKEELVKGAEIILCTGGMSVDADDVTKVAIKNQSAELITYGSPVLPGAMLGLGYTNQVPIVGIPAGFIFTKRSVFDLILPRLLANDKMTFYDIASYGHGGYCLNCDTCTYPKCGFGKA